ncbi:hypothetical protein OG883_45895 [Streptomyces sp. NBC_01142]|uniref:hypothetical protein n=1 Tax=Streptomyces sp. NBC_01142 TaxID=2975865 RepID=UPI00225A49AC|nr:hypothetical protein [Streptomyces sp. NBC_01142]MCX4826319.1 hypothetical protein [Streptomyces sp. NBC_01142]MCX4826919.1 hypothetical protein [Streptomyces sp. NBC_01142]MCX4826974.1 hypothetical protein [Streptomyces sp. NBC_01142]
MSAPSAHHVHRRCHATPSDGRPGICAKSPGHTTRTPDPDPDHFDPDTEETWRDHDPGQ